MIVAEVIGVGIFLTPAGMARTLGDAGWVTIVWTTMGLFSLAGALCYAELGSRFPEAGGAYVYLREAFGERWAFVYGWMALLVMDPGLTAALGVGLATYLLILVDAPMSLVPVVAVGSILVIAAVSAAGIRNSARLLRWTAVAKLAAVVVLLGAVIVRAQGGEVETRVAGLAATPSPSVLAGALMGAFFAVGGWWDLAKMGEEVIEPRRTLPLALIGGLVVVTVVYAGLSIAFIHAMRGAPPATDEAFVATLGAALFGSSGGRVLAAVVVIAIAGSLAAIVLGAPRVYLAMARSGSFPAALVRFHPERQSAARATFIQVALACVLVLVGSFDQILGYFIPVVVFFLGLAAAALLRLPRPDAGAPVFRAPWHPLPVVTFLLLIAVMVVMFSVGRPAQTLTGALVAATGIPVSWWLARQSRRRSPPSHPDDLDQDRPAE